MSTLHVVGRLGWRDRLRVLLRGCVYVDITADRRRLFMVRLRSVR